jgi:hypothetical protein
MLNPEHPSRLLAATGETIPGRRQVPKRGELGTNHLREMSG